MATSVPPPPPLPPTGSAGPTNLGLAPNVGALLCYVPCCIGLIFSIVVAVVEKQSRYLRFHAFQSLLFHAALVVCCASMASRRCASPLRSLYSGSAQRARVSSSVPPIWILSFSLLSSWVS